MSEGHSNFYSIDGHIPDPTTLFDQYCQHACRERYQSSVRWPPWESVAKDDEKLGDFDVDLNSIDRIYHVKFPDQRQDHHVFGRMDHKGRPLYFHVRFVFSHKFRYFLIRPESYLTFDPEIFLKSVINHDCNPQETWKAMVADGVEVDEPSTFDLLAKDQWFKLKETPPLRFLCHIAIYENWKKLNPYSSVLPSCMMKGVGLFNKLREARDDREQNPSFPHTSIHVPYSLYP